MAKNVILLVEDSFDDVELIRRAFHRCKITNPLVVLHTGEEAVAYFQDAQADYGENADEPVLVLLDLNLPRLKGIEVLKTEAARSFLKRCPVVVLSGVDEMKQVNECYKLGATSFFIKPITDAEIMNLVRNIPRLALDPQGEVFELKCVK